ncbi:MAG: Glu-tRNA(Gln) amidotransferase subunit GatE [Phycisphaerales bacterium]|nr:MAG: Glu-tRNA(Gln) amidotransferase subunit GatE [Phycisphaerales bacterium]
MPFTFKPFHLMSPEDYAGIGLRCGLEVHRQLITRTKLFCRCPAGRYSKDYDAEILRHMRPTLSELGEYDGTALMEKKTRKNIHYRVHHGTVCTYEFDDTPPFFMADDALDAAIELALLLRLNLVSELHIARKQYLDGSIPTGFQRTTILGVNGWIPYKGRKIGIRQLGLEEDACREVSDIGHDRVYLTDRLGMPLVEPVTEPDMRTPQEAADVAQIIRKLCRSTGKVRTGIGTVRQDVNVSVKGGTRVEVKGVPQIWRIPRLVYNEARRQCALLHIRDELRRREISPETLEHRADEVTRIVAKTRYQPLRSAIEQGLRVKCVVLKGFAGLLNEETQEHTTFAKEFSDRVRVIACLTHLPNMAHSDTASESLYGRDWQKLGRRMSAGSNDALILVWGNEADTETACQEVVLRAREAATGVPSDTRQALKDGTNGFERVLPGADRMYPDTDLPPLAIPQDRVERIRKRLPEFVWDREARYRAMGLSDEMVEALSLSPRGELFSRLVDELGTDPTFAAVVTCQRMKAFRRSGLNPELLRDDEVMEVFKAYAHGRLAREGVVKVLRRTLETRTREPDREVMVADVLQALNAKPLSDEEMAAQVKAAVDRLDDHRFSTSAKRHRHLMGVLMNDLAGRADGGRVAQMVAVTLGTHGDCSASAEGRA